MFVFSFLFIFVGTRRAYLSSFVEFQGFIYTYTYYYEYYDVCSIIKYYLERLVDCSTYYLFCERLRFIFIISMSKYNPYIYICLSV